VFDKGRDAYAGLSASEWDIWTDYADDIRDAQVGRAKVGQRDSRGEIMSPKDVDEFKNIGDRIQRAAETHVVYNSDTGNTFFRGETFATDDAMRAAYPVRSVKELDRLTSATTDLDAARVYLRAGEELGQPVKAVLWIQNPNGVRGIQTAPMGTPSSEVIIPKGEKFRVAAHYHGSDGVWRINLYSKETHPGLRRVNASAPPRRHAAWDEDQHPREPAGSERGGEFAPAGGGGEDLGYPPGKGPSGGPATVRFHPAAYRDLSPKVADVIARREQRDYQKPVEGMLAIRDSDDGIPIVELAGTGYSVPVGPEHYRRLKDAVVTHNHPLPDDGIFEGQRIDSFSVDDIQFAADANVREMRATTANGVVYRMVRPDKGWPMVGMVFEEYHVTRKTMRGPSMISRHAVWEKVAKSLGIRYERIAPDQTRG
jgi:hypothetical protein